VEFGRRSGADLKLPTSTFIQRFRLNKTLLLFGVLVVSAFAEPPGQVVNNFAAATQASDALLRGATMSVDIAAAVPRLEKQATLHGLRRISGDGAVTYDSLQLGGDESVRRQVIARFLTAETNSARERDPKALAIHPDNYKFQYKSTEEIAGRTAYVFHVKPKRKREGSFQGDIWIDSETYLPLRESGKVLQHSIFLRRITLVRSFRIVDRTAFPENTDVDIDTRLVGKAQLKVVFRNIMFATSHRHDPSQTAVQ
jgi:hypothetical protein